MTDAPMDLEQHCWDRRTQVVFRARLSAMYHARRERFYDGLDKWTSVFTTLAATAAVATVLQTASAYEVAASLATAFLSLVPLVFNPAQKARHHGQLAAEFRRLLADCERAGQRWDESCCDRFGARVLDLEVGEPAPLTGLVAECQNQLAAAEGEGPVADLKWWHHGVKHLIDVRPRSASEQRTDQRTSA